MDKLIFVMELILANWQRVLTGGVILTSAIIFVIGCLKKAGLFDVIKNKLARKVVLAFSSIVLVFPFTALYFVTDGISFDYYWYGCAGAAFATIVTYWFYENTAFRDGIAFIGEKTVGKWFGIIVSSFTSKKSNKATKVELIAATQSLQEDVREEVAKSIKASVKVDDDLKNL